jgi:hypothetical protein
MPLKLFENPAETDKRAQELLDLVDAITRFLPSRRPQLSDQHFQHLHRVTLRAFTQPLPAERGIHSWIELLGLVEDVQLNFDGATGCGTRAERLRLALTLRLLRGQFLREYRELREKHGLSTPI